MGINVLFSQKKKGNLPKERNYVKQRDLLTSPSL